MNKSIPSIVMASAVMISTNVSASSVDGLSVGVNYGLFSGPTLELTYPINDTFQVRGALSAGMGLSDESEGDTDQEIDYTAEADGGIHRLAVDYHPFGGTFFLSAGYAVNNFAFNTQGTGTGTVDVGDETYEGANISLKGQLAWSSAPTLSLGWGHSPSEGWGAIFEVGAIFTGAPDVSLTGTGTYNDGADNVNDAPEFIQALEDEKTDLKDDVADFTLLPIFQAGVTYRF